MIRVQFTLFDQEDRYKPVSTIIQVKDAKDFRENYKAHQKRAITNICAKRYWDLDDLKRYGYTKIKYRKVD